MRRRARFFVTSSQFNGKGFFVLTPCAAQEEEALVKMDKNTGFMKALKCRECAREYPLAATHVCEFDFGPLEVAYDYARIKKSLTREIIQSRPKTMWRY